MNYAYLNASGDVISISTKSRDITEQKLVNHGVTLRIDNAPDGLVPYKKPDTLQYHRKTSGDGSLIVDYTLFNQPTVINPNSDNDYFGRSNYWMESNGDSETNSTTYIQKARLQTGDLIASNYRIGWYYIWNSDKEKAKFKCRIQVDDTTEIHVMEDKRSEDDKNRKNVASGFKYISLSQGSHFIDVDFCSSDDKYEVSISDVRLELWRV